MHADGLALTLLSLEDLAYEFVLRGTAHVADPRVSRQAWLHATSTARDQCGNVYLGDVLTASPVASGLDFSVSFSPGLDPRATLLDLTFRLEEAEWTGQVPLLPVLQHGPQRVTNSHPRSVVPALTLRRVAALAQAIPCDAYTLTLMSLEDHVDGCVVRSHFDSARVGIHDVLSQLTLYVYDERGKVQPMERAETAGHGTEHTCALDITWRSLTPLAGDATEVLLSVPWLRLFAEFPLAGAQRVWIPGAQQAPELHGSPACSSTMP
jgi:hypothetical protein